MQWIHFFLPLVIVCVTADTQDCSTETETYGGLAEHAKHVTPEFLNAMEYIAGRKLRPDEALMKIIVNYKKTGKIMVYGQIDADKTTWEFNGPDMKSAERVYFFEPLQELLKCREGELFVRVEVKPFIFETLK